MTPTFADWRNRFACIRQPSPIEGAQGRMLAAFDIPDGIRVWKDLRCGTLRTQRRSANNARAGRVLMINSHVVADVCVDDLFFVCNADYPPTPKE